MPNYDELRNLDAHITRQPPDDEPEPKEWLSPTYVGTITGFGTVPGSGLSWIFINGQMICLDGGYALRVLDAAFGGVIQDCTINPGALIGRRIAFNFDRLGILCEFTPEEEWDGPEPSEY